MDAGSRTKLIAAASLICVQTSVGVLYRISQAASGGFKYSTMSAIALAEIFKLCISASLHMVDKSYPRNEGENMVVAAWRTAGSQVSNKALMYIWLLAFLYTFNNQLSFYVYLLVDPGTAYLFKAGATMLVAGFQCAFVGKTFSEEQWRAMFLQGVGMIVVQYNPCKGAARYPPHAYLLMALSVMISSVCAVFNEYLVKNFKICLNVQNSVLYLGGALMNVFAFFAIPNPNSGAADIAFFDGYSNPLALLVILANAFIGLAITAVYKYADAVTKCIATDITAVLLCIISSLFFGLDSTITMWCGVVVVCFAVHMYTVASQQPPPAAAKPTAESLERKQDEHELFTLVGKEHELEGQSRRISEV